MAMIIVKIRTMGQRMKGLLKDKQGIGVVL